MDVKKVINGVVLSLVFLGVFFVVVQTAWEAGSSNKLFFLGSISGTQKETEDSEAKTQVQIPSAPYRKWEIRELDLSAESGIVVEANFDEQEKILYSKNGYMKLPIASITKLMTAVVAIENYNLLQNIKIKISEEAFLQEGNPGKLTAEMGLTANDLLYIMLIESNNTAALALSEGMDKFDFVRLMNEKARALSMGNTFFLEPTGLAPENVSTSFDLIKLTKYILNYHPEISQISRLKEYELANYGILINTDELLGEVPEIVVGKTGFTLEAKGCLLLTLKNPREDGYLFYVVLGADDRFSEMKKMIEWANTAYQW